MRIELNRYCHTVIREVSILKLQNFVKDSSSPSPSKPMLDLPKQQAFNYSVLDRQTQIAVKQKTSEIKSLIRQTAQDIANVGQKLAEVKQQLKHGEFRNWLKTEFNWSISSATKFMQVSEQFKNVNFTHFNFATSALYILAAPSTPEKARQHALQLASRGENITYSMAKLIVKQYKELAETNSYLPNQQNSTIIVQSDIQPALPVININQKDITQQPDRTVRIIEIKQEQPKHTEDKIQDFEVIYAGICVAVEGSPKDLTTLFKKMQNNPQFAEDIFRQARSVSE